MKRALMKVSLFAMLMVAPASAIASPPAAPVPVSPLNTTPTDQPTFVWNTTTGADRYDFWILYNNVSTVTSVPLSACSNGVCTYNPGLTLPTGNAWWLVRGVSNADGPGPYTDFLYFYVPLPAAPVQIDPTGLITDDRPAFHWYPTSGVTSYEFQLQSESRFLLSGISVATSACTGNPVICTYAPGRNLADENHWWYVRSVGGAGGTSAWAVMGFRPTPPMPAAPTVQSPVGTVSTANPTFVWNKVTGANFYYFRLADENGTIVSTTKINATSTNCAGSTCTYTLTAPLKLTANLNAWWWVQCQDNSNYSDWSAPIGVRYVPAPLAAPTTVSPLGTITLDTPSFVWNPVTNASSYDVYVVDQVGTKLPVTNYSNSVCTGSPVKCTINPGVTIARGLAWWWVRARDASNFAGVWTSAQQFTVNPPTLAPPTQFSPSGIQSSGNLSYSWSVVSGATYQLWLADEIGVKFQGAVSATCTATTCTANPNVTLSSGNAWWWVRSVDSQGGAGAWAGPMSFHVP